MDNANNAPFAQSMWSVIPKEPCRMLSSFDSIQWSSCLGSNAEIGVPRQRSGMWQVGNTFQCSWNRSEEKRNQRPIRQKMMKKKKISLKKNGRTSKEWQKANTKKKRGDDKKCDMKIAMWCWCSGSGVTRVAATKNIQSDNIFRFFSSSFSHFEWSGCSVNMIFVECGQISTFCFSEQPKLILLLYIYILLKSRKKTNAIK